MRTTRHLLSGSSWSHIRVPTRVSGNLLARRALVPRGIRFHRTRGVWDQPGDVNVAESGWRKRAGSSTCKFVDVDSMRGPVELPWESTWD
ncbi:hypothetical protein GW17_00057066 [Ensete ventricosum]|nr:hypothetical protein GW17_00057066 [Ensete ventricosum]